MRAKCLAQEHNTLSQARARTRTARSGDERTNHEATMPPLRVCTDRFEVQFKWGFHSACYSWSWSLTRVITRRVSTMYYKPSEDAILERY